MTDEIQKDIKATERLKAWDRFWDSIDMIVSKVTSGKFLATALVVWTYCHVVKTCCHLVEIKTISAETFLAVMAGIAGLVTMIVKDYFNKENQEVKNDKVSA